MESQGLLFGKAEDVQIVRMGSLEVTFGVTTEVQIVRMGSWPGVWLYDDIGAWAYWIQG